LRPAFLGPREIGPAAPLGEEAQIPALNTEGKCRLLMHLKHRHNNFGADAEKPGVATRLFLNSDDAGMD
jgi:hypothetical protein